MYFLLEIDYHFQTEIIDKKYIVVVQLFRHFLHTQSGADGFTTFYLQGVPYSSLPKSVKPRRVELYFSSWCIRAGNLFSYLINLLLKFLYN